MGHYIPNTPGEREYMLKTLGVTTWEELFAAVPEGVRVKGLHLPPGLSELEVSRRMEALSAENHVYRTVFRGAGSYRHYIPAAVRRITANETFLTAYTPYQAEISQGVLQSIFEYQTMICELTGMDASNASAYDGASAAAEGAAMCRERNRTSLFVSEGAAPQTLQTLRTYCRGYGMDVRTVPLKDGKTGPEALKAMLTADAAGVYIQQPNYFGLIEDLSALGEIAHGAGAKLIAGCNPIALGLLESPGACGADIAVGEGQPLGLPMAFGGPYLGFMACKAALLRKLPGRIVGQTRDAQGRRAFVLTLQAREQHIRREKASSNLCSNEALCALTAGVYLAVMGAEGLAEAARQCRAKAVYAARELSRIRGFELAYPGEFFNEFVTACPDAEKTLSLLKQRDILGGLPLGARKILWCCTEVNTKAEIDELVATVKEAR